MLLDIAPTYDLFERMDQHGARARWHWLLHLVPDLAPRLLSAPRGTSCVACGVDKVEDLWTARRPADRAWVEGCVSFTDLAPVRRAAGADYEVDA